MRIIAGIGKGRRLQTIEGIETRPTLDRIKETLFNIIAFDIENSDFLDLFSGSGSIGIEALSRGANSCVFVDNNSECEKVTKENLNHAQLTENASFEKNDIEKALKSLNIKEKKFHIIYIDPPYESGLYDETLQGIKDNNLLHDDGIIVVEHNVKNNFLVPEGLEIYRQKKYKVTALSFLSFCNN